VGGGYGVERRAFIAVILMFLVLIMFEMVMRPRSGPVPEGDSSGTSGPAQAERVPSTDPLTAYATSPGRDVSDSRPFQADSAADTSLEVIPAITEKRIQVKTDLIEAVLTNRGPAILSWKLKMFEGPGSEWVELVPDGELGGIMIGPGGSGESEWAGTLFETETNYLLLGERNSVGSITFVGTGSGGLSVRETLRFDNSTYLVAMDLTVDGASVERGDEMRLGWISSLPETEPDRKDADRYFAAIASIDSEVLKKKVGDFKKEPTRFRRGTVHWAGVKSKYFAMVMVPEAGTATALEMGGDREAKRLSFAVDFPAKEDGGWRISAQIYGGPIDHQILNGLGLGLEKMVDFGHKLIRPLSKLIYWLLVKTYNWVPNYGVVIIILSALTKVLFYPLTQKSMKSMQSMQQLQPKMAALKEKHKNDPKRMNKEVMKLYKGEGVNPVGGCLPLLLQSPVFFALYAVLQRTIELRQAPFALWMDDLSRPDVLLSLPSPLPALSVLPILMGASMFLQQRFSSTGGDPRQKMMGYMMPIFMVVIFFRMPSGLVLYWLVNTVLSVGQQYVMKKKSAPAAAEPAG